MLLHLLLLLLLLLLSLQKACFRQEGVGGRGISFLNQRPYEFVTVCKLAGDPIPLLLMLYLMCTLLDSCLRASKFLYLLTRSNVMLQQQFSNHEQRRKCPHS